MRSISVERPICCRCNEPVYGFVAARDWRDRPICGNCDIKSDTAMQTRAEEVRQDGCPTCGGTGIQTAHGPGVKAHGVCLACVAAWKASRPERFGDHSFYIRER